MVLCPKGQTHELRGNIACYAAEETCAGHPGETRAQSRTGDEADTCANSARGSADQRCLAASRPIHTVSGASCAKSRSETTHASPQESSAEDSAGSRRHQFHTCANHEATDSACGSPFPTPAVS